MTDDIFTWKNLPWQVGMRWGDHHPDTKKLDWYGKDAVNVVGDDLYLDIIPNSRYFDDVKQTKLYETGCVSCLKPVYHGIFYFEYTMPVGIHIWPAIWMYSEKNWPPEIDIMEGWTGNGLLCRNRSDYRRMLCKNNIYPTLHYTEDGKHCQKTLHDGLLGGTFAYKQPLDCRCSCKMVWRPESIDIFYNDHHVCHFADKEVLDRLDEPMNIILDLAVGENFTGEDCINYCLHGSPFIIHEVRYSKI